MLSSAGTTKFDLKVYGTGSINDVSFDVSGIGAGDTSTGEFAFTVTFSKIAPDTDPFANVLGVLILPTGAFGRELGDAVGFMSLSGGVFEFTQMIMGEGVEVTSTGKLSRSSDHNFAWESMSHGSVKLRSITAIEPFSVVMIPQGPGKITEVIALPLVESGCKRTLHSVRHFTFTPGSELRQLQLRDVSVSFTVNGLTVQVQTRSSIRRFFASGREVQKSSIL